MQLSRSRTLLVRSALSLFPAPTRPNHAQRDATVLDSLAYSRSPLRISRLRRIRLSTIIGYSGWPTNWFSDSHRTLDESSRKEESARLSVRRVTLLSLPMMRTAMTESGVVRTEEWSRRRGVATLYRTARAPPRRMLVHAARSAPRRRAQFTVIYGARARRWSAGLCIPPTVHSRAICGIAKSGAKFARTSEIG